MGRDGGSPSNVGHTVVHISIIDVNDNSPRFSLSRYTATIPEDVQKGELVLQVIGCERERNVLFNDTLNTFYLGLYGIRHMVKDHSDSEKGNPLPPHRLLLSINSTGPFICTIPQTG